MHTASRARSVFWREMPWRKIASMILASCFALSAFPFAQTTSAQEAPEKLVRAAVANEAAAAKNSSIKHMFRSRRQSAKGSQTRLYVETNDAMAAMLVAVNDHPLTAEQQQTEDGHLSWLMNNPDQLRKKQAREKEDADRTLRIVKALPDAFVYQYDGTVTGTQAMGSPGAQLARLKFSPNHNYNPPSRVEEVLSGMEGYLLIDVQAKRLAKIDGTLYRDINFGWGLVGRLDKGGHFIVQQANLGDGSWDITDMHLDIKGKILLVKSLSMVSDEVFSDYRRLPDNLPFAKGVEMLKAEVHHDHSTEAAKTPHP
jgi:hypothetical protein